MGDSVVFKVQYTTTKSDAGCDWGVVSNFMLVSLDCTIFSSLTHFLALLLIFLADKITGKINAMSVKNMIIKQIMISSSDPKKLCLCLRHCGLVLAITNGTVIHEGRTQDCPYPVDYICWPFGQCHCSHLLLSILEAPWLSTYYINTTAPEALHDN